MTDYFVIQTDNVVNDEIWSLEKKYAHQGLAGLIDEIDERIELDSRAESAYLIQNFNGALVAGNLKAWPSGRDEIGRPISFKGERIGTNGLLSEHFQARVVLLKGNVRLMVGRSDRKLAEVKKVMREMLGGSLTLILVLGVTGGLLMSIGMLRRLDAINRMSRDIMTGDLSHRVPVRGTGDDFDTLAGNLNAMLARIQDLMVTVKGVSENIAHDLRTPLARLRSRLEAARIQPPTADLYETWVDGTIAEVDKVLETFEALLKIAEIESGKPRESFAKVDLTSVVADVVEFYEPLAEERDQRFDIAIEAVHEIIGDRNLLFRALANLIDNAIKYAPLGGYVGVTLRNDPSGPTVLVADNGPGIPPQAHEKVFRRLFRLETSRSKPGNGLGLSLVAAVVDLHGIVMTLDDNSPGLRVSLRFKQA